MLRQIQLNRWSCLLTSFAMVMDISQQELVKDIGHDGSEILFPEFEEPANRRAFHFQDFVYPALKYGLAIMEFEPDPTVAIGWTAGQLIADSERHELKGYEYRFNNALMSLNGVLVGLTPQSKPHGVAWYEQKIYDPNGTEYKYSSKLFHIWVFFAVLKIMDKRDAQLSS